MQEIGCDGLVFSGHKMYADTGIGVLALRRDLQKYWQSPLGGGGAINFVSQDGFEQAGIPERWEPGTPNIVGAISLTNAIEYIKTLSKEKERYKKIIEMMNQKFVNLRSS